VASGTPRVVVVVRSTPYEALLERHATRGQARFFLESRGQDIAPVEAAHLRFEQALGGVLQAIPPDWRRAQAHRRDLDRFLFEPEDIVVAVGQDGLVANVSKYLTEQPVIGINPLPDEYDGVLVPHAPESARELMQVTAKSRASIQHRTMARAELDDGQHLLALNEIFVGHRTHQSARYRIAAGHAHERQSSSGLIVATGTGATGWARSINLSRDNALALPEPVDRTLAFFVREAFPSVATGVGLTAGHVPESDALEVISEMNDGGVIFGDGMEGDRLEFGWGQTVRVRVAKTRLALVSG